MLLPPCCVFMTIGASSPMCTSHGAGNPLSSDAPRHLLASADIEARLRDWVTRYDSALSNPKPEALNALASSNLSASFNLAAAVPNTDFFVYVNSHMPWLDALEQRMGLNELWQPGQKLLAIGAAHGMIDAVMSSRHGHRVTAYDLPRLYLRGDPKMADQVRSRHCTEIETSPFAINSMADALVQNAPRPDSYDAVSFGGSTISVLQKAGSDAHDLLSNGCKVAKRWVFIFQEPLVPQGTQMHGGECSPLPHCRPAAGVAFTSVETFLSGTCNVVPNCRDESQWQSLFRSACPNFELVRHGVFGEPIKTLRLVRAVKADDSLIGRDAQPGGTKSARQKWYVLQKREASLSLRVTQRTERMAAAAKRQLSSSDLEAIVSAFPVEPSACPSGSLITVGGGNAASYAGRYVKGLDTKNEGQYRICLHPGLQRPGCTAISFGVEQDISFESDLAQRTGCTVHAFDPTEVAARYIRGLQVAAKLPPRVNFHPVGLWNATHRPSVALMKGQSLSMRSLETIMAKHLARRADVDVAKFDCEGCAFTSPQKNSRAHSSFTSCMSALHATTTA